MLGLEAFAAGYVMMAGTQARPSWCNPDKAPQIRVVPKMAPIAYDFSKPMAQMNNIHIDTVNPYGNDVHTDTGGVMHGSVQLKASSSYRTTSYQGLSCAYFEKITISVELTPKIYIAREYPRGGCKHRAVMEHELKHVAVERQIANKYAQIIGNQMVAAIKKYPVFGPVPSSQQTSQHQQMTGLIQNMVSRLSDKMALERKQRQQAVDNINEYNRVNKILQSCKN